LSHFENLFITTEVGKVHCGRFTSIVCRFIDDYITAKLINIASNTDLWMYVFTNEICILYQIRYDIFVKPTNKKDRDSIGDNPEYEKKASLIRTYRNKLLAHPEKQFISQLELTKEDSEELSILLQDSVLLLHIYQYLHEDLYEKLRLNGSIGGEDVFHMGDVHYTQDKYNEFKQKLLNKLNIDDNIFLKRWDDAIGSLNLYRLNYPESGKGRHIKFIFHVASNEV